MAYLRCASSCLAANGAGSGTRGRYHSCEATLSTTDGSSGSWQNQSEVDSRRGTLLPAATDTCLKASEASNGPKK
jgi:hypothetical protein